MLHVSAPDDQTSPSTHDNTAHIEFPSQIIGGRSPRSVGQTPVMSDSSPATPILKDERRRRRRQRQKSQIEEQEALTKEIQSHVGDKTVSPEIVDTSAQRTASSESSDIVSPSVYTKDDSKDIMVPSISTTMTSVRNLNFRKANRRRDLLDNTGSTSGGDSPLYSPRNESNSSKPHCSSSHSTEPSITNSGQSSDLGRVPTCYTSTDHSDKFKSTYTFSNLSNSNNTPESKETSTEDNLTVTSSQMGSFNDVQLPSSHPYRKRPMLTDLVQDKVYRTPDERQQSDKELQSNSDRHAERPSLTTEDLADGNKYIPKYGSQRFYPAATENTGTLPRTPSFEKARRSVERSLTSQDRQSTDDTTKLTTTNRTVSDNTRLNSSSTDNAMEDSGGSYRSGLSHVTLGKDRVGYSVEGDSISLSSTLSTLSSISSVNTEPRSHAKQHSVGSLSDLEYRDLDISSDADQSTGGIFRVVLQHCFLHHQV